jgi:hypothetical protein
VSQYVSGNFPGIFGIFKIFFVALTNYLAIFRLFFSRKYFLKIKRNRFFSLPFLHFWSAAAFGPSVRSTVLHLGLLFSTRSSAASHLLAQFLFQPNNQSLPRLPDLLDAFISTKTHFSPQPNHSDPPARPRARPRSPGAVCLGQD